MAEGKASAIRWEQLVLAALLALLAIRALVVPVFVVSMRHYPIDYVISEGDQLVLLHQLLNGQPIYGGVREYPILGNIYPPVYPILMWAVAQVAPPTMATLRIFALVPLALSMLLLALFLGRAGAPKGIIAAAMLLVPCGYSVSQYLVYARCDGWMSLFAFASLYFFWEAPRKDGASPAMTRNLLLGSLCAALALFSKQTAIFGVVPVALHLLIAARRRGLLAAAATLGTCVALLGLFLLAFGMPMIDGMFFLTTRRTLRADRLEEVIVPYLGALSVLISITLCRMVIHLVHRKWDLLDTFILGHGVTTALIVFDGSGTNYLLPAYLGMNLAAALGARELCAEGGRPRETLLAAAGLCALHLALQTPYASVFTVPEPAALQEARLAADFLRGTPEPAYAERSWTALADRAPSRAYFVEPVHLRQLPPGRLDLDALQEPFRNKRYARILMYYPGGFHVDGIPQLVAENYRMVRTAKVRVCFGVTWDAGIAYFVRKE